MARLGYGVLRQPTADENDASSIELGRVCDLVDRYMALGGNYFDTAYTYHGGASEAALRKALVERYPRERFVITDKLPTWQVPGRQACETYFNEQLQRCGVEYFDYYFLHWLNRDHYEHAVRHDFFSFLSDLKQKGLVGKIGFSYHDDAATLDRILTEQPCIEVVQLQLNYLDWESDAIQSRKCYEVAQRHGKPVFVMEPIKGGSLASLPPEAKAVLDRLHPDWSPASWAIRFVASLSNVAVLLSGMNELAQVDENFSSVGAEPLGEAELEALRQAAAVINQATAVPCTACRYCEADCPMGIRIPSYFALYNAAKRFPADLWKFRPSYHELTGQGGDPGNCIDCLSCEKHCPQHIKIATELKHVQELFLE